MNADTGHKGIELNDSYLEKDHGHDDKLPSGQVIHNEVDTCQMIDDTRTIYLNQESGQIKNDAFKHNGIRTSKYTLFTFLPLNLLTQFQKAANCYFLIISYMQTIKSISISNGVPASAYPLAAVVFVAMLKDAFEDYKRNKSDNEENFKATKVYRARTGKYEDVVWKDLKPGNLVKVSEDEAIPADLVLVKSSDPKGTLYIETKNLDGETNLKNKYVHKDILSNFNNDLNQIQRMDGSIFCEAPNNAIYKFEGQLLLQGQNAIPLGSDNIILRGCSLRNTEYIYGVVIFTGHDTKIMMNSMAAKYKFSGLELYTNYAIAVVLLTQFILASIGALIGTLWIIKNGVIHKDVNCLGFKDNMCERTYYIDNSSELKRGWFFKYMQLTGTWIIMFTNFVPISLLVSLDLVKLYQGFFMSWDVLMYDDEEDMAMRAQAINLNEELGQVEYIFSDKTGTLTCNVMEFKKFSAGYEFYGTGEKATTKQLPNVNFHDPKMFENLKANDQDLIRTIIHLAVCHDIIIDEKKGVYNAASPDELALVNAAKQFGYEYAGMDADENMTVKTPNGPMKFKRLNVCEFTSTRKRMSVIVEDKDKNIILMCKGADSVITDRLSQESLKSKVFVETDRVVTRFANEGLRTLYLSQKYLDRKEWESWNEEVLQAKLAIQNREEKVAAVDEKIEVDMELIGSTAIEDKLQDEVADTIQFAKAAGIKVWVLTGDKIETATNIGFSAGLLDNHMTLHSIEEIDETELLLKIGGINTELDCKTRPSSAHFGPKRKEAIIVAGSSLIKIDEDIELRENFLKAATRVDVVLACRVSPKQKADVVNLIKKRFPEKTTLSIGDGANDVSMILQAHVGVGILGKEGQQAARSADFAIGQFKFLKPLLFFHGREAYRRNSLLVLYNFYKNFLYVVPQFYFGFYAAFAGQPLYEQLIYQMYNITMTSLPILWFSIYDLQYKKDIDMQMTLPKQELQGYFMRNPLLYRTGIEGRCFSTWLFVKWLLYSLLHAGFIFYACFYVMVQPMAHQSTGLDIGFWTSGMTVYGVCIFVANTVIAFKHHIHNAFGVTFLFLCTFSYFFFFWIFSFSFGNEIGSLFLPTFQMRIVYASTFFIVSSVYLGEVAYSGIKRMFRKEPQMKNTETEKLLGNNEE